MTPNHIGIFGTFGLPPAIEGSRRFLVGGFLLFLAASLTGCLSRPPLTREHFLISLPTPERAGRPRIDDTLNLGVVSVAPQFEGRSLAYRLSENAYEFDSYAEFVIPPDRMIGGAARSWLRDSGLFRDITEPNSYIQHTRVAELHVTEIYGDFRKADDAAAVFTMRFVLLDKAAPNVDRPGVALTKVYSRRMRLPERTAAAVVRGLQQGFAETMTELAADLGKL